MPTSTKIRCVFCVFIALLLATNMSRADEEATGREQRIKAIKAMEAGALPEAITQGRKKLDFHYRLFVPETASIEGPLPLVVFLHGKGRRGTDNIGPMELAWAFVKPSAQRVNPCFVLAGQVPPGGNWVATKEQRSKMSEEGVAFPVTDEMTALLKVVDQVIEERPIDPARVYVVGQSMGGYGTWDALYHKPDSWAAAVPVCGGGMPHAAATFKDVPIWAWHGDNDRTVPVSETREMIEALKAAGGSPRYTEIHGGGHGAWNHAFSDAELFKWLFNQKKSSDSSKTKDGDNK